MNIIGITHCHNATISLLKDNNLCFCQSEERFNRIKNSTGFPYKTLEYLYQNIIDPKDVDIIVIFEASIRGYTFLKKINFYRIMFIIFGALGRSRTCGPQIRNLVLYPTELQAH